MSQTIHVVRCVNCKKFQSHIVKRVSNKWTCKLCDTKQTLIKVFGEGTGAECRQIVQTLNLASGRLEEAVQITKGNNFEQANCDEEAEIPNLNSAQELNSRNHTAELARASSIADFDSKTSVKSVTPQRRSKWAKYSEED